MKLFTILFCAFLAFPAFPEEKGRLDREKFDFRYTYLGINFISANNAENGLALYGALSLPGPLYLKFERRGDGIDFEKEIVDKTTDSLRLGAQAGIGDVLSGISAGRVNLSIKNIFEIYGELGVKSWSVENNEFDFDENEYEAHFVSGIHFGDSNGWEGKIFLDISSEAEPIINDDIVCLELDCPTIYEISDDQNRRFGLEAIYNRGKYTAFTLGASTNSLYDSTTFEIGFRVNL
tara:strand:- start:1031 stop:1735 length:705 start_codon:yes stop_codon:yes gene_type:complete